MSNKNLNSRLETYKNNRNELMEVCLFLESKGLECRESSLGTDRVQYYRGRDLKHIIEENKFAISEMIEQKIKRDIGPKGNNYINNIYEVLLEHMILIKADKYEEDVKKKFPKKLKPLSREELMNFDENKLYIVKIERKISKSSYVYLMISILLVLLFCTFPIWPISMKFALWWLSLIFLSLMLLLFLSRLIILIFSYIFGYELWLLPNLFDLNLPFLQSFSPIFGYCPVENDWRSVLFRILLAIGIVLIGLKFYMDPQIALSMTHTTGYVFNETLTWGYNKLSQRYNYTSAVNMYTRHRNIMEGIENDL